MRSGGLSKGPKLGAAIRLTAAPYYFVCAPIGAAKRRIMALSQL